DTGSGRARALAAELGGEAVASNRELAERADVVVLAHKPYQLESVAAEVGDAAKVVVSLLAGTTQQDVRKHYPAAQVFRGEPNVACELRQGMCIFAEPDAPHDEALFNDLLAHFDRLGAVAQLPERLIGAAGAISGVGPAYWALLAEAWVDAGVRNGLRPEIA